MSEAERRQHEAMTYPYGKPEARFRRGDGRPVVSLDIDGTLGDYHAHFLWFAEQYFGTEFPSPTEVNPGMRLSTFMGIPHHMYQECKLAYRQGGLKRFMPCYPGAAEMTKAIHNMGAEVWICTTRPYLRLDNIDPDTREWLRRNHIFYDAVLFEGVAGDLGKYGELVRQVPVSRIVSLVDDLPEQIVEAHRLGISDLLLRDQPYNRGKVYAPEIDKAIPVTRVHGCESMFVIIAENISEWKARNE